MPISINPSLAGTLKVALTTKLSIWLLVRPLVVIARIGSVRRRSLLAVWRSMKDLSEPVSKYIVIDSLLF